MVIAAAGFMYCVEFFADKTPGVDTSWDAIHSFIRIPAAAALAAGAVGELNPAVVLAAAILGGAMGATSHTLKTGTRVLINASPEPFTNWAASFAEDIAVVGGLLSAIYLPLPFVIFLIVFVLFAVWALPKLWRGIIALAAKVRGWFGVTPPSEAKSEFHRQADAAVEQLSTGELEQKP